MTLLRRQVRSDAERGEVATPPEERQAAHSDGSVYVRFGVIDEWHVA